MVELFSTTAVAMAGLSMGLVVGSSLADRTSSKKTPLSQGGVDAASNNGLSPGDSAAVYQGLPSTKAITTRPVLQEYARAIGIDRSKSWIHRATRAELQEAIRAHNEQRRAA